MHACLRMRLNEPLFAGCHLPLTYIGMEYIRTNNLTLAEQVFSHNAQRPIVRTSPHDMWEAYGELLFGSFWNRLAQCAAQTHLYSTSSALFCTSNASTQMPNKSTEGFTHTHTHTHTAFHDHHLFADSKRPRRCSAGHSPSATLMDSR